MLGYQTLDEGLGKKEESLHCHQSRAEGIDKR